ncbi:prepilin peptidase [Paenibacillus oralis]|uniref:Prepilin peptidase n=1 Tax=Paenibacillus oralis TaxID=2490856 RepID=A0A3P3UAS3_9BACL|nr:A24 family peptidase [Paenibacillus oralis]RRJ67234.1 prepilin peptidase [Paenibacillus oralis]
MLSDLLLLSKGLLFGALLLVISFHDIRTREIPNRLPLAILGVGMLEISIIPAVTGLVVASLPYLLAAIITNGKIGGGDIKLMAASGFVLGPAGGLLQSVLGLSLVLFFAAGLAVQGGMTKAAKTPLPLAPFLSAGGFAAFWLLYFC